MVPTAEMHAWVRDFSGVDPRSYETSAGGSGKHRKKPGGTTPAGPPMDDGVGRAARDPAVWTRSVGPALTKDGPYKAGARLKSSKPVPPATVCTGPSGRTVSVARTTDGRVALTRPPPPITEITFSGGGGKGSALPGAVWALEQTGALAQSHELHGASVGSMTAAMLAAGSTAGEFQATSDETNFKAVLMADNPFLVNENGQALEVLVRDKMKSALNARIAEFVENTMRTNAKVAPAVLDTLTGMSAKFASGAGPTFGDLRALSKVIPAIKEVVISGTLIGQSTGAGMKPAKPELKVFSADTEPDMDVACAVHASAALPPVFKAVELKMRDGSIGRFEDGGVLNNAPSGDTLGSDRAVDPVPEQGKMTFVFEEDAAHEILAGTASPRGSRLENLAASAKNVVSGADNSAAVYANNKTLSERPEDVVMVPLKFDRTNGSQADYSGLGGTLAFDMKKEDRIRLQGMTEADTAKFVKKRREDETRTFASDAQMLCCAPRDDLVALATSDFPAARDALKFRDAVEASVVKLEGLAGSGVHLADAPVQKQLKRIDALAVGDQERVAFIGRALNRSGKLDAMLREAKDGGAKGGTDALDAAVAVNAVLVSKAAAKKILEGTLYSQQVRVGRDGMEGELLARMETMLRAARSAKDINRALTIGIDYYSVKHDLAGAAKEAAFGMLLGGGIGAVRGAYEGAVAPRKFADVLREQLQPLH